jgi:hypothetical protein
MPAFSVWTGHFREMTGRGACSTEWSVLSEGSEYMTNRETTALPVRSELIVVQ